jgi:CSLREA domain-containing protein
MLVRPRAALALLAFLLILALPASASAANFVVNSTADEADAIPGGFCESAGGKCTLRAAIEVTNLTLAEKDKIEFSNTVFKGTLRARSNLRPRCRRSPCRWKSTGATASAKTAPTNRAPGSKAPRAPPR